VDVADPPRIEKLDPLAVDLLAFEEEIPLFGEAQLEPGQVDLLLIGFDGGEIGIDGEVPRHRLSERVTRIQAGLGPDRRPILESGHDMGYDLEFLGGPLEVQP